MTPPSSHFPYSFVRKIHKIDLAVVLKHKFNEQTLQTPSTFQKSFHFAAYEVSQTFKDFLLGFSREKPAEGENPSYFGIIDKSPY